MKKSVSSFLDQMSSALNPLPEDEDEALMIVGSDTVTLSRLQVVNFIVIILWVFKFNGLIICRHKFILWLMIQIHF